MNASATEQNDIQRDVMEYDVVIVGAGPAGLSCAIRLKQLQPDINVCVLEKAATVGAHALSGAVIEPGPLDALLPEWRESPPDICVPAMHDEFRLLTRTGSMRLPLPPQLHNHGNFIISLGLLTPWLAQKAEVSRRRCVPGLCRGGATCSRPKAPSRACSWVTWGSTRTAGPAPTTPRAPKCVRAPRSWPRAPAAASPSSSSAASGWMPAPARSPTGSG